MVKVNMVDTIRHLFKNVKTSRIRFFPCLLYEINTDM